MTTALLLALALAAQAARAPVPVPHPLDPLSPEEIAAAVATVRASKIVSAEALFPMVALQEPPKHEVLAHVPGRPARRQAFLVLYDRARNETSEAVVDLAAKSVASWRVIPGVQPPLLLEEFASVPRIVRADPLWQEAMRRRGITDFAGVHIDPWAPGTIGLPSTAEAPRLVRALSFYKGGAKNTYARPIEGVTVSVDMNATKVIDVADTGVVPVSSETAPFDEASQLLRPPLKPLETVQPDGPDFVVKGGEVSWQKWRFRFSMHPREGLLLSQVAYDDDGTLRPVLYRASISEMLVPYGDPDSNWAWRSALDEGEYGLGRLASPLEPGVDVPSQARLFDAHFADDAGGVFTIPGAVSLYERDGGILWKHYSYENQTNESRRARELVLMTVATISNYDYSYAWIFRQDGSLHCELGLTGIMLPKGVPASASGHDGHFAHLVSSTVAAPHHQHFFSFRLDFDVDGTTNTVYQADTRALPAGRANPAGNAMTTEEAPLATAATSRRDLNAASARRWVVRNPLSLNTLGQPTGFALVPGENTVAFLAPESPLRRRAAFINHHLWVTPYDPDQLYAAGDYPSQSAGRDGLERWTRGDDPLVARDVVVWYTLGVTHTPRPEEWPVMPVTHAGFKLLPSGFFKANPALDVPRPPRKRKK